MVRSLYFLLVMLLAVQTIDAQTIQSASTTLKAVSQFPFGAALNPRLIQSNADYRRIATREFSSITSENVLKMHHVHPTQNRYDWSGGDALVVFARRNNQRMHGHTLLWHKAVVYGTG